MTVASEIVAGLVDRIFRIATLLDAVTLVIGIAALGAIGLLLFLTWALRAPEMETAKRLGAGRFVIVRLAVAEIALLLIVAAGLAAALVVAVTLNGDMLVAWILAL
jgi:putative ABC transport system permease protein